MDKLFDYASGAAILNHTYSTLFGNRHSVY